VVNDKLDLADEAIMAVEKDEVVLEGEIKSDWVCRFCGSIGFKIATFTHTKQTL